MTPQLLRRCLVAVYGPNFITPASAALDIGIATLQRMLNGKTRIYPHTVERVRELVRGASEELLREIGP